MLNTKIRINKSKSNSYAWLRFSFNWIFAYLSIGDYLNLLLEKRKIIFFLQQVDLFEK